MLRSLVASVITLAAVPATASASVIQVDAGGGTDVGCGATQACRTIQAGVDAAAADDVLQVAAGVYDESPVIDKPLALRGAQVGVDARNRAVASNQESVVIGSVELTASADGVSIDGFEFRTTLRLSQANQQRVQNNIVQPGGAPDILLDGTGAVVRRNFFDNGTDGDVTGAVANQVLGIWSGSGTTAAEGIRDGEIVDNRFRGHESSAVTLGQASRGVRIARNSFSDDRTAVVASDGTDIAIDGNSGAGFSGPGFVLAGGLENVRVTANQLADGTSSAIAVTNAFGDGPSAGVEITGNSLVDFGRGTSAASAGISVGSNSYTGGMDVHFNRLVGMARAIRNASTASIDAENNFFGCDGGPGDAGCSSAVLVGLGTLDVAPHLVLRTAVSPNAVLAGGDTAAVVTDLRRNSAGVDLGPIPFPPTTIDFAVEGGGVTPTAKTAEGVAMTIFTSAVSASTVTVTAALDAARAPATVTVRERPVDGAPGTPGTAGPAGAAAPPGAAGGVLGARAAKAARLSILSRTIVSRRGRASVTVRCPSSGDRCTGALRVVRGAELLGSAPYDVRAGRTQKVAVRLPGALARTLGPSRRAKVQAVARGGDGLPSVAARKLTVRVR